MKEKIINFFYWLIGSKTRRYKVTYNKEQLREIPLSEDKDCCKRSVYRTN